MKKIIELAEKALDVSLLSGFYITQEMENALLKLSKAIKDRKTLEQTPITEDWLREHGWVDCDTDEVGNHHWYYLEHGTYGIEVPIFCTEDGRWYVRGWDFLITTIAQLLDALELCGINMED